jgi:hypothetical protein
MQSARSDRPKLADRSLDLEINRRCLPAVLFELILDLLPFIKRAQSGALDRGDMHEHVLAAATLRLNESIAFQVGDSAQFEPSLQRINAVQRLAPEFRRVGPKT